MTKSATKQVSPKEAARRAYIYWHSNLDAMKNTPEPSRAALWGAGFEHKDVVNADDWWANANEELDRLMTITDQADTFDELKHVPKKEVLKCKPGTWLLIKWMDQHPVRCLLIEKPEDSGPGSVGLVVFDPETKTGWSDRPESDQVIAIGPRIGQAPDFNG